MLAWARHIILIGYSIGSTTRIAERISAFYGMPVVLPSSPVSDKHMGAGKWLQERLLRPEPSVIVSPTIHLPFTYHVLMNRDKASDYILHVLTDERDNDRWKRISPFYHHLSDAEIWADEDPALLR